MISTSSRSYSNPPGALASAGVRERLISGRSFQSCQGALTDDGVLELCKGAEKVEELGRTEEVAEAYERFLELWQEADPAFKLMGEEGREHQVHLTEEGALPAPQER